MKKYLLSIALLLIATPALASNTEGFAWSESLGWFDFSPMTVSDTAITGYAYNDNTGWLVLDGVTNTNGELSGYAWSESVGWFDFGDVSITSGTLSGYAYNDNTGWLSFEEGTNVTTTWAPAVSQEPQTESRRSGSSGSKKRTITPPNTTPTTNTPSNTPNIQAPNTPSSPNNIANNPRDLELNMEGDDVKLLQQFLNQRGYIVNPNIGQPGSIGYETNFFGNLTRQALIKFQLANNINPPQGYFGPITRAFIKTLTNNN